MDALKRTADAQSSLQEQFDRHKCEPPDSSLGSAGVDGDALLRQGQTTMKKTKRKMTPKEKMMTMKAQMTAIRSERKR
jgi:hypothetical protein